MRNFEIVKPEKFSVMKTTYSKLIAGGIILTTIFACKKTETVENGYSSESFSADSTAIVSDSISSAATMIVKDKQFIKTAGVNVEVKDVYDTTISLEKSLKELGGFVIKSNLQSNVVSQETFNTSDKDGMMLKKFQTENTMDVRIPTEKLGEFLQIINDKKLFLNSRTITAEDVTANIKYAELESKRIEKTSQNISTLKNDEKKVDRADGNMSENNFQKLQDMTMTDNLKYSTIHIYMKEPQIRIAEIAVTNSKNIDNKYKFNFFYDVKNAFVEGFYLIQTIVVGLIRIWPLIVIGFGIFFLIRKKKSGQARQNPDISKT